MLGGARLRIMGGRAGDVEGVSPVVVAAAAAIFEESDEIGDICGGGEAAGRLRLVFNSGGDVALEEGEDAFSPEIGGVGEWDDAGLPEVKARSLASFSARALPFAGEKFPPAAARGPEDRPEALALGAVLSVPLTTCSDGRRCSSISERGACLI